MFTPKGRVITLPVGSTPVDFAYAVHTEVGHRCIGSKVNGRLVSLDHTLTSGDTCEIFTSKVETAGPSQDWLGFAASHRAQNKIRQWFSRERRVDMIEDGRDELTDEFRREGLPVQRIWSVATSFTEVIDELSYVDLDTFLAAIGEHHVSAAQRRPEGRRRRSTAGDEGEQLPTTVLHAARPPSPRPTARSASTSRASTTCWCGSPTAARRCPATRSSASSPAAAASACTASTAPTRCRSASEQATRMIDVEWDGDSDDRHVQGRRRGRGARPLPAAARRRQRAGRPPRQHRRRARRSPATTGWPDALRVRAVEPGPAQRRAHHDQADRRRLRRVPDPPRRRPGPRPADGSLAADVLGR